MPEVAIDLLFGPRAPEPPELAGVDIMAEHIRGGEQKRKHDTIDLTADDSDDSEPLDRLWRRLRQ